MHCPTLPTKLFELSVRTYQVQGPSTEWNRLHFIPLGLWYTNCSVECLSENITASNCNCQNFLLKFQDFIPLSNKLDLSNYNKYSNSFPWHIFWHLISEFQLVAFMHLGICDFLIREKNIDILPQNGNTDHCWKILSVDRNTTT